MPIDLFSDWVCGTEEIENTIKQNLMALAENIKDANWEFSCWGEDEPHIYAVFGDFDELTEYVDLKISPEIFRNVILKKTSLETHPADIQLILDGVRKWGEVIKQLEEEVSSALAKASVRQPRT